MNLYEALEIPKNASLSTVRAAYRRAAKKAHPDHGGTKEKFAEIVLARDVLSDETRRERYDRTRTADETEADQTESAALVAVMEAVSHVFQVCEARRLAVETVDVVKDGRTFIETKLHGFEEQRRQAVANAKKFHKFAARFHPKKKDGLNRIRAMIDARAAELERDVEKLVQPVAVLKRAMDILAQHSYVVDKTPEYSTTDACTDSIRRIQNLGMWR